MYAGIKTFILVTLLIALALFITPVIHIGFGYLGGLVAKWVFGGIITDGLNTLFGTNRFNEDHIPIIAATLAMIASYFKSTSTQTKDKEKQYGIQVQNK